MIMKIPMETTVSNLNKLSKNEYEHISILINDIVDRKDNVSVAEALSFGDKMCDKYSDAFKVLAS